MSQLKRLAGDTAIYGVSSILGKSINFLLVFLHTSVFLPEAMGVITVLYSFVAILNVIFTFGMETAFFRFINKEKGQQAFHIASTVVILISTAISALIILNASTIATLVGYPDTTHLVTWLGIILWIDGVLSITFARLRQENKSKVFATVKVGNILVNVTLQLFFLGILPGIAHLEWFSKLYDPSLGVGYIILANLIANILYFPFLWKYIIQVRFSLSKPLLKKMLLYATPILLMGMAGMTNEMLGNILLEHLLPDSFYPNMDSTAAVGVYGQTFKLSIFMMLAIQAFRYAGEPFFFNNAQEKNAPELFARVMHYFVMLSLIIFVLISLNTPLLGEVFLRKPEYRVALYLVPILLVGKLFYGIYVNLNIWFKLTDKTIYGTYFSVIGALVTIIGNVMLIPIIGFLGSAVTSVLCYFTMASLCYFKGRKHYPIPYKFGKLLPYFIGSLIIATGSFLLSYDNFVVDTIIRIIFSIVIVGIVIFIEKPTSIKKPSDFS